MFSTGNPNDTIYHRAPDCISHAVELTLDDHFYCEARACGSYRKDIESSISRLLRKLDLPSLLFDDFCHDCFKRAMMNSIDISRSDTAVFALMPPPEYEAPPSEGGIERWKSLQSYFLLGDLMYVVSSFLVAHELLVWHIVEQAFDVIGGGNAISNQPILYHLGASVFEDADHRLEFVARILMFRRQVLAVLVGIVRYASAVRQEEAHPHLMAVVFPHCTESGRDVVRNLHE